MSYLKEIFQPLNQMNCHVNLWRLNGETTSMTRCIVLVEKRFFVIGIIHFIYISGRSHITSWIFLAIFKVKTGSWLVNVMSSDRGTWGGETFLLPSPHQNLNPHSTSQWRRTLSLAAIIASMWNVNDPLTNSVQLWNWKRQNAVLLSVEALDISWSKYF